MTAIHFICLGIPPRVPPCGAAGETDKAAEKHVRETSHSVVAGTDPDALARIADRHNRTHQETP